VPDKRHSAKIATLGKALDSGSASPLGDIKLLSIRPSVAVKRTMYK
jgi:hypothetical protein